MVKRVQCVLKQLLIATCFVIVPALAHSTNTPSALVADGPIANWKFDETSGQTLIDSSGNGNTGYLGTNSTAETADPTRTLGKVNNALKFDGTDDRATIAIEQNRTKPSRWGQLAKKGHQVVQFQDLITKKQDYILDKSKLIA